MSDGVVITYNARRGPAVTIRPLQPCRPSLVCSICRERTDDHVFHDSGLVICSEECAERTAEILAGKARHAQYYIDAQDSLTEI